MLEEEDLAGNAARMGRVIEEELSSLNPEIATSIRGIGLFWAIVIKETNGECYIRGTVMCAGYPLPYSGTSDKGHLSMKDTFLGPKCSLYTFIL